MEESWLEKEGQRSWSDALLILACTAVLVIIRKVLNETLFTWGARRVVARGRATAAGLKKAGKSEAARAAQEASLRTLGKFKEGSWRLLFYTSIEIYTLAVTVHEPWFRNTADFWAGWPNDPMKNGLRLVYAVQLGFYIEGVLMLVIYETRRKDFAVMVGHHFATLGLLGYSYIGNFLRVGNMVLLAHDCNDVLLDSAKLAKYSGLEAAASVLFVLFVLSWVTTRLVYFPFWIIYSTTIEAVPFLKSRVTKTEGWLYYYSFNTLLITLLVLHLYWFALILKVLARQIQSSGTAHDVRSDSEDEN